MTCYSPLRTYVGKVKEKGKVNVVWRRSDSWRGEELDLPCGQCIGCRLERSRQWSVRCMHEASLYERNCFITLTYEDKFLPKDGSLDVGEWQDFMKRLRKQYGRGIRFFHCGEYGEKLGRPHYHGLLFNFDFDDKVLHTVRNEIRTYTSAALSRLWPKGFSTVGDVTFESAAYVARYSLKKVTGERSPDHYGGKKPEYCTMSRRPGIGRGWYDKFKTDVFPSDEVVVKGRPTKPPRFYDNLLADEDKKMFDLLKFERERNGRRMVVTNVKGRRVLVNDNDCFRLPVKEFTVKERLKLLKRPLEVEE